MRGGTFRRDGTSSVEAVYVGARCCVLRAPDDAETSGWLVLEEETDLAGELDKLRVKDTLATEKKEGKKPWWSLPDMKGLSPF